MSSSSLSKQTRVIFGSSVNHRYVDYDAFYLIKYLTSLVPGVGIVIMEPSVQFNIPASQIVRPQTEHSTYSLLTDTKGSFTEASVLTTTEEPKLFHLQRTPKRTSVDRITIFRETKDNTFSVVKKAHFCDVRVCTLQKTVEHECWGLKWLYHFRECYLCPYYEEGSPADNLSLYFRGPPLYEIEVVVDDWVDEALVLATLEFNLPDMYRSRIGVSFKTPE